MKRSLFLILVNLVCSSDLAAFQAWLQIYRFPRDDDAVTFFGSLNGRACPSSSIGIPYLIILALKTSIMSSCAFDSRASSYLKSPIFSFFCAKSFSILTLIAVGSIFEIFRTSPNSDSRCSVSFSRKLNFLSSRALLKPIKTCLRVQIKKDKLLEHTGSLLNF